MHLQWFYRRFSEAISRNKERSWEESSWLMDTIFVVVVVVVVVDDDDDDAPAAAAAAALCRRCCCWFYCCEFSLLCQVYCMYNTYSLKIWKDKSHTAKTIHCFYIGTWRLLIRNLGCCEVNQICKTVAEIPVGCVPSFWDIELFLS